MTKSTDENLPKPQKGHLNQNLVIAIIGAVATLGAAIIPWMLDRAAKAEPTPTAIQATFTVEAPPEATATSTLIPASATPTAEPPTATAAPPTEETGIYNAFLAFDFEGKLTDTSFKSGQPIYVFFNLNDPLGKNIVRVIVSVVDVPGVLVDSQFYNTTNEYKDPNAKLVISQGGLKPGKYKVELYLNNTLDETLEFEVTK
ncbi:MAG: hypothetical protein HZB18_17700 [Chloroflexi bacterium]|nr:hypothetical protein [Chloroflexota bacterium]